jgi:hypothetical protein
MDEQRSWRLLRRLRWALRPVLVILLALLRCQFRPSRRHSNPTPVGFTSTLTDNSPLARTAILAVRHLDIEWEPDGGDWWTAKSMARQLFRKQSEAAGATFDRLGPLLLCQTQPP